LGEQIQSSGPFTRPLKPLGPWRRPASGTRCHSRFVPRLQTGIAVPAGCSSAARAASRSNCRACWPHGGEVGKPTCTGRSRGLATARCVTGRPAFEGVGCRGLAEHSRESGGSFGGGGCFKIGSCRVTSLVPSGRCFHLHLADFSSGIPSIHLVAAQPGGALTHQPARIAIPRPLQHLEAQPGHRFWVVEAQAPQQAVRSASRAAVAIRSLSFSCGSEMHGGKRPAGHSGSGQDVRGAVQAERSDGAG